MSLFIKKTPAIPYYECNSYDPINTNWWFSTPLKNISQIGLSSQPIGENKIHVPNHQPVNDVKGS
jgi:hypothetical protein